MLINPIYLQNSGGSETQFLGCSFPNQKPLYLFSDIIKITLDQAEQNEQGDSLKAETGEEATSGNILSSPNPVEAMIGNLMKVDFVNFNQALSCHQENPVENKIIENVKMYLKGLTNKKNSTVKDENHFKIDENELSVFLNLIAVNLYKSCGGNIQNEDFSQELNSFIDEVKNYLGKAGTSGGRKILITCSDFNVELQQQKNGGKISIDFPQECSTPETGKVFTDLTKGTYNENVSQASRNGTIPIPKPETETAINTEIGKMTDNKVSVSKGLETTINNDNVSSADIESVIAKQIEPVSYNKISGFTDNNVSNPQKLEVPINNKTVNSTETENAFVKLVQPTEQKGSNTNNISLKTISTGGNGKIKVVDTEQVKNNNQIQINIKPNSAGETENVGETVDTGTVVVKVNTIGSGNNNIQNIVEAKTDKGNNQNIIKPDTIKADSRNAVEIDTGKNVLIDSKESEAVKVKTVDKQLMAETVKEDASENFSKGAVEVQKSANVNSKSQTVELKNDIVKSSNEVKYEKTVSIEPEKKVPAEYQKISENAVKTATEVKEFFDGKIKVGVVDSDNLQNKLASPETHTNTSMHKLNDETIKVLNRAKDVTVKSGIDDSNLKSNSVVNDDVKIDHAKDEIKVKTEPVKSHPIAVDNSKTSNSQSMQVQTTDLRISENDVNKIANVQKDQLPEVTVIGKEVQDTKISQNKIDLEHTDSLNEKIVKLSGIKDADGQKQDYRQTQNNFDRTSVALGKVYSAGKDLLEKTKSVEHTKLLNELESIIKASDKKVVKFDLKPENLGSVKVSLDIVDKQVTAKIEVANETVRQMILVQSESLKNSLTQSGIQLASLNVSVNSSGDKSAQQGKSRRKESLTNNKYTIKDVPTRAAVKNLGYNTYDYVV